MNYSELLGIIDAEYDVVCDMPVEEMVTYLVESFDADPKVALRVLENYGLVE